MNEPEFEDLDAGKIVDQDLFLTERLKDLFKTSNGKYIAPTIRNTQYNYDRSVIYDYDYDLEKNFSLSRKETDVALIFGYQYEGWSEIFGGCYAGFGYSYKSYQEITENGDNEEFELKEKKKANPRLYLGMTVGFSF